MYVCICNAFTESAVERTLADGARTAAGVYRALGCTPQCGKCVPLVREMVRRHREAEERGATGAGLAFAG